MHPQLNMLSDMSFTWAYYLTIGVLAASIINRGYFLWLAGLDVGFTLAYYIYKLILKPNLLSGKIKGYYWRDYSFIQIPLKAFIAWVKSSVARFYIILAWYLLNYLLALRDAQPSIAASPYYYRSMLAGIFTQPLMTGLALGFSAFMFYLIFYSRRYATIQELSNGVMTYYRQFNLDLMSALERFVMDKDKKLEHLSLAQVKYDETDQSSKQSTQNEKQNQGRLWTEEEIQELFGLKPQNEKKEQWLEGELIRRRNR